MTRFTEELRDLADQAPALRDLGGMADRALATARLRQRVMVPLTAAGAFATVVALVVAIGSVLPRIQQSIQPAGKGPFPDLVLLPDDADPLPAKGVERAMFSYESCLPDREITESGVFKIFDGPCTTRILTVDDRAYEVRAAQGSVQVSPDGHRIAYFEKGGRYVVRDLASGARSVVLTWTSKARPGQIYWTADGRRLLVQPGEIPHEGCDGPDRSLLIDIATRKSTRVPGCRMYGITDEGAPFPGRTRPGSKEIPLFDHAGKRRGEIPARLLEGTATHWDSELIASISPDGRRLAISEPDRREMRIVDLGAQRARTFRMDRESASGTPMGWADERRVVTAPLHSGSDIESLSIHTIDVSTGKAREVVEIRNTPDTMLESVAYRLLGSG